MSTLGTDLDLMRSVAATIDTRSEEIRAMLQGFVGRMRSVPPTVWGGSAAARFHDVMGRWDAESATLVRALHGIAELFLAPWAIRHRAWDIIVIGLIFCVFDLWGTLRMLNGVA